MIMLLNPSKKHSKKAKKSKWMSLVKKHGIKKAKKLYHHKRKGVKRTRRVGVCKRWKSSSDRWKSLFVRLRGRVAQRKAALAAVRAARARDRAKELEERKKGLWGGMKIATNRGRKSMRKHRKNGSRRYHYTKRRNYSTWIPAFGSNPGAMVKEVTKGFQPSILLETLPVIGGYVGTQYMTGIIGKQKFVPSFLTSGWGVYPFEALVAGLMYVAATYVLPKHAKGVLLGGAVRTVGHLLSDKIIPEGIKSELSDFSDYATVSAAQLPMLHPLGDYVQGNVLQNTRPLNGIGFGTMSDAEELMGSYMTAADAVDAVQRQY